MLERGTLAFINKINPCGPQIPTVELESRMAARVIAGKLILPPNEEMMKSAELDMEWRRKFYGEEISKVSKDYSTEKGLCEILPLLGKLWPLMTFFKYLVA